MKSRIQSTNLGQELRVMALNNAHIVAQIRRDLKDRVVGAGEQGSECMPHCVRRNPRAALPQHPFAKRALKVVAVAILAVLLFGMKHEGLSQTVLIANEGQELTSQRDAALLAVLKLDRGRFPKVKNPGFQIEPERSRLNDFHESQTGMKAAVEHKFQILPLAFINQAGDKLGRAEVFASGRIGRGDANGETGIVANGFLNVPTPIEETTHGHKVSESGSGGSFGQPEVVIFSDAIGRHVHGPNVPAPFREGVQNVVFRAYRCLGPSPALPRLSPSPHVIDEPHDSVFEDAARLQFRGMPVARGVDNRLAQVAGIEGNIMPLFFLLDRQPIDISAFVDAPRQSLSGVHAGLSTLLLSHFASAQVRQVRTQTGKSIGVYGARTRNLRRDRARDFIGAVTPTLSRSLDSGQVPSDQEDFREKRGGRTATRATQNALALNSTNAGGRA